MARGIDEHPDLRDISVDYLNKLVGGLRMRIIAGLAAVYDMFTDMILDDLGDEPIEGTPARSGLLQDLDAFKIGRDRALNRLDLTAQAFEPVEQLGLFLGDMAHDFPLDGIVPYPIGQTTLRCEPLLREHGATIVSIGLAIGKPKQETYDSPI